MGRRTLYPEEFRRQGYELVVDGTYTYHSTEKFLRSGTTIVFYSDGLIESRGQDLNEGMTALRDKPDSISDDPEKICDELMAWRLAERSLDDAICILAARLG